MVWAFLSIFAGLFDAEGNVFLEDGCFRWSCLNLRNVEIYKKHLMQLGLFHRYDGCNLITYNMEVFTQEILPYLKHPDKINKTNLLCHKKGRLDKRFLGILKAIHGHQGATIKTLAKLLKKVKVYAQMRFLERLNYIEYKNYPKQIFITQKGLKELRAETGISISEG